MTKKQYELKLCNNGTYYLYYKGALINNPYITFDKFNKEDAEAIVNELNNLSEDNEQLKEEINRKSEDLTLCIHTANDLNEKIDKLNNENKKLKSELSECYRCLAKTHQLMQHYKGDVNG